MEQIITGLDRNIQLDALIRTFESQPQGCMELRYLELMASYLWQGEQKQLLEQLLDDGLICYGVGPEGMDMNLTKAGAAWIAAGGYSAQQLGEDMIPDVEVGNLSPRKIGWVPHFLYLLLLALLGLAWTI